MATTFRLTEHHTAGGMSRWLPWLDELQPEMFAEIDPVLAAERGIEDGGWMTIETERAEIEARARVTERMRPLQIDGKLSTRSRCRGTGASAAPARATRQRPRLARADPNISIQESKAFVCDVRAGRATARRRRSSPASAPTPG